ncbi:MAG: glycosyltransferase family 2 protein [Chloroflexi bacterium]|nr:glycosyltransferase family 2 protein [Chloroflexota bacterium]
MATERASVALSVVVVSFNTHELLRACLDSVLSQRLPPERGDRLELIVVDNASSDGSADMVETVFGDSVGLVRNKWNLGFAAANNLGLRRAKGRYVMLLNSDTVVQRDAFLTLVRFMDHHPEVGMAGPRLLNPDGTIQPASFHFPTLLMLWLDFFPSHPRLLGSVWNGRYRAELAERPFSIDHPLGACIIVRREAMDEVGILDEGFFMYCEEVDWCYRMRASGWKIYHVPNARVLHYGGQSARQVSDEMFYQLHRSRLRLIRRHFSPRRRALAEQIIRLGLRWRVTRAWIDVKLGRRPPAHLVAPQAQYQRILQVLSNE